MMTMSRGTSPTSGPDFIKKADEPQLLSDPIILEVAERNGVTAGQVLIAWAIQRGTSVIPKSSNPDRLRENLAAGDIELSGEDMDVIDGLDRHYRFIDGEFWCTRGMPCTVAKLWDE